VTLRVVGDDEKGSLKSETVKYHRESQGPRTRERLRWQGPVAYAKDRPVFWSILNIKMDLREIGWDGMHWIDLAQDMNPWSALVNKVINHRIP
jgi:hypothetical protein